MGEKVLADSGCSTFEKPRIKLALPINKISSKMRKGGRRGKAEPSNLHTRYLVIVQSFEATLIMKKGIES
jgi:hypothetical protein